MILLNWCYCSCAPQALLLIAIWLQFLFLKNRYLWRIVPKEIARWFGSPNVPKDVIIFKKKIKLDCDKYHICAVSWNIWFWIDWISSLRKGWLPEGQHGFRSNRSTVNAIFINRMRWSHAHEKGITLFKCFVDLTKHTTRSTDQFCRRFFEDLVCLIGLWIGSPPFMTARQPW